MGGLGVAGRFRGAQNALAGHPARATGLPAGEVEKIRKIFLPARLQILSEIFVGGRRWRPPSLAPPPGSRPTRYLSDPKSEIYLPPLSLTRIGHPAYKMKGVGNCRPGALTRRLVAEPK